MKAKILLAIIAMIMPFFIKAQITMSSQLPNSGIIQKDQLWNIVIINNGNDVAELTVQMDVRDVLLGQSVLTATAAKIIVAKGMKIVTMKDVGPIMYNYVATEYSGNYIPCGTYTINYRLVQETIKGDVPVADEVIKITVAPLSPPLLIMPANKSGIDILYPQFAWTPPVPMQMFAPLVYDITVVTIEDGQLPKEAMEYNKPVYVNANLQSTSEKMPTSFEQLQRGKNYAWQVVARSGFTCEAVSEVWEFKITPPVAASLLVEQTPFIKMKKYNPDKGIAPNGILKASYQNETSATFAIVNIVDMSGRGKKIVQFQTKLQPGENLIQYDLKKIMALQEGRLYEAQIVNDRNEIWVLQFEYHEYKEQRPVINN